VGQPTDFKFGTQVDRS